MKIKQVLKNVKRAVKNIKSAEYKNNKLSNRIAEEKDDLTKEMLQQKIDQNHEIIVRNAKYIAEVDKELKFFKENPVRSCITKKKRDKQKEETIN